MALMLLPPNELDGHQWEGIHIRFLKIRSTASQHERMHICAGACTHTSRRTFTKCETPKSQVYKQALIYAFISSRWSYPSAMEKHGLKSALRQYSYRQLWDTSNWKYLCMMMPALIEHGRCCKTGGINWILKVLDSQPPGTSPQNQEEVTSRVSNYSQPITSDYFYKWACV